MNKRTRAKKVKQFNEKRGVIKAISSNGNDILNIIENLDGTLHVECGKSCVWGLVGDISVDCLTGIINEAYLNNGYSKEKLEEKYALKRTNTYLKDVGSKGSTLKRYALVNKDKKEIVACGITNPKMLTRQFDLEPTYCFVLEDSLDTSELDRVRQGKYKMIIVDNFARETVADELFAESCLNDNPDELAEYLNMYVYPDDYLRVVEKEHKGWTQEDVNALY